MKHDAVLNYQIKTQNIAWGLRQEMGYPLFAPTNDCTAFAGGGLADLAKGMEIAVLAAQMRKDVIYLGWQDVANPKRNPDKPAGGQLNEVQFNPVQTAKVRILFTHRGDSRSGVSEILAWPE